MQEACHASFRSRVLRIVLRGRFRANAARSRAGTRPLEYFTKWDEFGGVQISPDGEFIAALTGKYGRSMLVFQDLKNKKTVATVGVPEYCEIGEYYWVAPRA